jgi:hypothetical protein
MIERLPDWEERLHAYLASLEGAAFAWGRLDCALFVAGAVETQTGHDFAAPFRGRYQTARGSVRALRKFGAGTLAATISAALGETPVGYARRGDVVMADGIAGLCLGGSAVFVGEADGAPGWVQLGRGTWSHAWAVG